MRTTDNGQRGFHVVELLVVLAVLALVGLVGWFVFGKDKDKSSDVNSSGQTVSYVAWEFDGDTWKAQDSAPACEDPLTIGAPMDVSKATGVLMPGQMRGTDFKPHGGLALDYAPGNEVTITAPRDAYLYRGAHYTVGGESQYLFDFIDPCGVMYRFDHLNTLTGELATYAEQLPKGGQDETFTHGIDGQPFFKKGTVLSTAVGTKNDNNVFFDLGVYDLRQPNAASRTALYKTDQKRIEDKEQSFYALCWFNFLPEAERAIVSALPGRGGNDRGDSDYCQ
jgi:hypothetical protein